MSPVFLVQRGLRQGLTLFRIDARIDSAFNPAISSHKKSSEVFVQKRWLVLKRALGAFIRHSTIIEDAFTTRIVACFRSYLAKKNSFISFWAVENQYN